MFKHKANWCFAAFLGMSAITLITASIGVRAQVGKLDQVSIGTQIWPGALPLYVAIAKGYTTEQRIDVARIIVSSGGDRRVALLADEIQFAEFAFSNVAVAAARNVPIKFVMSTHDYETFSLIVRTELKNDVKKLSDLKGRTVGYTTPGAGAWAWAKIYLAKAGLVPEKDVNMVGGMSETGVILSALKSGKVDAYPSWEPITTIAIRQGIAYPLISIWEPEVHREWVGVTAFGSGLATTEKILRDKPDLVRRMVAAVKSGVQHINASSAKEIAELLIQNKKTSEFWGAMRGDVLIDMISKSRAAFAATNGEISKSGVEHELKISLDAGIIKRRLSFDEVVDARFAGTKP